MTNTTISLHDEAEAFLARIGTEGVALDFDSNSFVHRLLALDHKVAAIWSIEDVRAVRPHLTHDQACEVLEEVGRKHDAEYGISWTTLECMADILFGPAPESSRASA